jgi:hypothetical protein
MKAEGDPDAVADGHLMSQGDKLKLQRGAATDAEFKDRSENRHHDGDGTARPRKSPVFLSLVDI